MMDELLPFEALEERARRRLREQERIQHRNARMVRLWNEGSRQPGYPGVIEARKVQP